MGTFCAWGRCTRPKIRPDVTDSAARYQLPHYGRFCQAHTEQVQKTQAGRAAKREQRVAAFRERRVTHLMPAYEKALRDWQCIMDALDLLIAIGDLHGAERDMAGQAVVNLLALKPKKPE